MASSTGEWSSPGSPCMAAAYDGADATCLSHNGYGEGKLGILMLHIELLHVSCAQIYSRPVATKSTPGRLGRKQVSIYCNESYSLYITQRATPCLLGLLLIVGPRATPDVLCRNLFPMCCLESYSRFFFCRELLPVCQFPNLGSSWNIKV